MLLDIIRALTFEHDYELINENKDPIKIRHEYYDFMIQINTTLNLDMYQFNGHSQVSIRNEIRGLVKALVKTSPIYRLHDMIIYFDHVDFMKIGNIDYSTSRWILFLIERNKIYWKVIHMKETVSHDYIKQTKYFEPELSSQFIPLTEILEKHPFIISYLITSCSYSSIINGLNYHP